MDEYIEREAVLKAIESVFMWNRSFGDLFDEVRDIPSEDVAPVRHGVWKRYAKTLGECSECGEVVAILYKYCPNCGADMRGSNDE